VREGIQEQLGIAAGHHADASALLGAPIFAITGFSGNAPPVPGENWWSQAGSNR
jgi:hypothetical protein